MNIKKINKIIDSEAGIVEGLVPFETILYPSEELKVEVFSLCSPSGDTFQFYYRELPRVESNEQSPSSITLYINDNGEIAWTETGLNLPLKLQESYNSFEWHSLITPNQAREIYNIWYNFAFGK